MYFYKSLFRITYTAHVHVVLLQSMLGTCTIESELSTYTCRCVSFACSKTLRKKWRREPGSPSTYPTGVQRSSLTIIARAGRGARGRGYILMTRSVHVHTCMQCTYTCTSLSLPLCLSCPYQKWVLVDVVSHQTIVMHSGAGETAQQRPSIMYAWLL